MSVEKIILRSFLNTLLAILILLVFMFGMLVVAYPETMMHVSYDMGMEKASVWFAERAYNRHDKIDTIAFATTVAIQEGMNGKIISCGDKMIADEEFAEYCAAKDEETRNKYGDQAIDGIEIVKILGSYDQYVYAQICLAQYRTGDTDGAVERARALTVDFPRNNAIACLLLEADSDGDEELVGRLLAEMDALNQEAWEADHRAYYQEIYAAAQA